MAPKQLTQTILFLLAVLCLAWTTNWRKATNLVTKISPRTQATIIYVTAQATPIHVQTLRFIASPLATPAPLQPITVTGQAQLPSLTRDLLFANEQGLMRWRHATHHFDSLIAWKSPGAEVRGWPGVRFEISADGLKVLVANRGVVNNVDHFALQLYDLKTEKITTLVTDTTSVLDIALAPDASWIAYSLLVRPQSRPRPWWKKLFAMGGCQCGEAPVTGVIYALRVQPPYQALKLSDCSEFAPAENCFGLRVWPIDKIKWAVQLRTPIIGYAGSSAHLVALPELQTNLDVSLSPFTPRFPFDRYVTVWIHHRLESSDGILDTQTAKVTELPGTVVRETRTRQTTWLSDGRLAVVRPALSPGERYPAIELWSINPTGQPLLNLDQLLRLPISAANYPGESTQLENGQLAFALFNTNLENDFERGLFLLDLHQNELRKVNRLPTSALSELYPEAGPLSADIVWSPDGAGVIFVGHNEPKTNTVLYIPADGSAPYDLRQMLGEQAWGFTWLPE